MDGRQASISPLDLHARRGTALAPLDIDVRPPADFATADRLVASAFHCARDAVEQWGKYSLGRSATFPGDHDMLKRSNQSIR
jgi:hypothetical protein